MRLLHTSDWHLGRALEGRSRTEEHQEFLDELWRIARDEKIDLVVVAGDVFDSANPPAAAEAMYYDALQNLADGGRRAVVVTAGNHDSPARLRAADPLALRHGISLVGYPNETLSLGSTVEGVRRVNSGPGWFEVHCPSCDESAIICSLTYPSESRLNQVLEVSLDDKARQLAYAEKVRRLVASGTSAFRPGTACLITGHLFVLGGVESESERQIQLGGAFAVPPDVFGSEADYVALGHLHRAQSVMGASVPCRYSGSPLAFSFSEADQRKEVVVVEIAAGSRSLVKSVPLTCGMPLKTWPVTSIHEALKLASDPRNQNSWVRVELDSAAVPGAEDLAALHKAHPRIVQVRMVGKVSSDEVGGTSLLGMTVEEQFRLFYARQMNKAPEAELVDLFLELCGEGEAEGFEASDADVQRP